MTTQAPTVSFRKLEEKGFVKRADGLKAKIQDIHITEGFNARFDTPEYRQSVNELADLIADGLQVPPLECEGIESGVGVIDGHTRTLAHLKLWNEKRHPDAKANKEGTLELWIPFFPTRAVTQLEKWARIEQTQDNRKLSGFEMAFNYTRMRDEPLERGEEPLTMEQIAKLVGKTRAHVEQMLKLETADDEMREMVSRGEVSTTIAVNIIREHGGEATAVAQAELKTAQSMGKKKITSATMSVKKPPRHILEEIASHYELVAKGWSKEDRVKLVEYQKGIIDGGTLTVPVSSMLAMQLAFEELQRITVDLMEKQRLSEEKASQQEAEV